MSVSFNKRDPVYIQVVRQFKEKIATGTFEPGQEIPSRRELANQLKINPNTAQRAYKEMEEEGLIYTEGNNPSRITKDEHVLAAVRGELLEEAVDSFITSIRRIQVPFDELVEVMKEKYQRQSEEEGGNKVIEVKDITKKFGRKQVLRGVTFTAAKGEITCLIGINGVGKTTILNAIMALTPINSGQILIDGAKINKKSYEKITFIPDAITMLPQMTIGQSMQFMQDFYESWNQERATELLGFFKLKPEEKISSLSKGNTAKVNLLLGLALDVDYLLMDEPFSGIDIFSREQIAEVFTSHLVEDRGVIITTHEINDIEHLIDQVILMDDGIVVKAFNSEEIRENEGKSVVDVMREVYQQ